MEGDMDYRLVRLLSADNPGLSHVKELVLSTTDRKRYIPADGFETPYTGAIAAMATLFVQFLPKHILQRFV